MRGASGIAAARRRQSASAALDTIVRGAAPRERRGVAFAALAALGCSADDGHAAEKTLIPLFSGVGSYRPRGAGWIWVAMCWLGVEMAF